MTNGFWEKFLEKLEILQLIHSISTMEYEELAEGEEEEEEEREREYDDEYYTPTHPEQLREGLTQKS